MDIRSSMSMFNIAGVCSVFITEKKPYFDIWSDFHPLSKMFLTVKEGFLGGQHNPSIISWENLQVSWIGSNPIGVSFGCITLFLISNSSSTHVLIG